MLLQEEERSKQMKIGLLTIYHVPNYGSVLQTYATQTVLERLGHECIVIQYNYRNDAFYEKLGSKRDRFKEWQLKYIPFLKSAKIERFRKKYFNFSKAFEDYRELKGYNWDSFDAFVVGSDQVWNTKYVFGDPAFLLEFAPSDKRRISISSSFAMKTLPMEYREIFKKELERFTALSVREYNGIGIINNDLGIDKPVRVLLDPTLLLNNKDWLSLIPRSSFKKEKPYILLYLKNYAFDPRPYIFRVIEYYKNALNADVVVLEGHRELDGLNCPFIDSNRSSVPEFIDLFANADLVITSSFHGTAFALNFAKPLVSVVPDDDGDDRQSSLLRLVGAEECIVKIGKEPSTIKPCYDTKKVTEALNNIRVENINWIKKELQ